MGGSENAPSAIEPERLGQLLFDTVGARLVQLGIHLAGTASLLEHDPEAAWRIRQAIHQLDEVQRELRRVTVDQIGAIPRPPSGVLVEQVNQAASTLGFTPTLQLWGSVDQLPDGQPDRLLAVVNECLLIVAGHAGVTWMGMDVTVNDGSFTVTVEDDGSTSPAASAAQAAHALATRTRLGGRFTLKPRSPTGTTLRWHVPNQLPLRTDS